MNTTALTQLIDRFKELRELYFEDSSQYRIFTKAINEANKLLEREAAQIVHAYSAGQLSIAQILYEEAKDMELLPVDQLEIPANDHEDALNYYKQTYTTIVTG